MCVCQKSEFSGPPFSSRDMESEEMSDKSDSGEEEDDRSPDPA